MRKRFFLMYTIFILAITGSYGQVDIHLSPPVISGGTVINDSFYVGHISIESLYTGEDPFMGMDKKAYYTLNARDADPPWNEVPIEETSREYVFPYLTGIQRITGSCSAGFTDGKTVIVWKTLDNDNHQKLYFQLFDSSGSRTGEDVLINTLEGHTMVPGSNPAITVLSNNTFFVVWDSCDENGCYNVYGRRYSCNETRWLDDEEFELSPYITVQDHLYPSIVDSGQEVVAVWTTRRRNADNTWHSEIQAQRFDYDGYYTGDNAVIMEEESDRFYLYPQITRLNEQEYILLFGQVSAGIFIQKLVRNNYTLDCTGPKITLHQKSIVQQSLKVEALINNGFVVVWSEQSTAGGIRLYGRHFNDDCQALSSLFQIDSHNDNTHSTFPHTGALDDSGFAVCWRDYDFGERQGSVMIKRYSKNMEPLYESLVREKDYEITTFSACITGRNRIMTIWADRTDANTYQRTGVYYPAQKRAYTPGTISPQGDIDIQFKVVDPISYREWLSPVRSYQNTDPYEGQDSGISYPGGFYNQDTVKVMIDLEEGRYRELHFYIQKAILENGQTGNFGEKEPYGTITSQTREMDIPLSDGYSYKFLYTVTNMAGITYEIKSGTILGCDLGKPDLLITVEELDQKELTLVLEYGDTISGIDELHYQLNNEDPVRFTTNVLVLMLDNGPNHVVLTASDRAGNTVTRHLFRRVEIVEPAIRITGIEDQGEYGDTLVFRYEATVQVTDTGVYVDNEFVQSADSGVVRLNLSGYEQGDHTIAVRGRTLQDVLLEDSVSIWLNHGVFTLVLLSPQEGQEYGSKTIPIEYWTGEPVADVWYSLNHGERQTAMELTGLADGAYDLTLYATDRNGSQASVSSEFTVKEAIPELAIMNPVNGRVYPGHEIELVFSTNAMVRYELGEETGSAVSGTVLTVPGDGNYLLTLIATHPVSGNVTRETIAFTVDTVKPELTIVTPESRLYGHHEINIDYRVNKPVKETIMLLDGEEVKTLANLKPGTHTFEIHIVDYADRRVEKRVDFTVSRLEIVTPREGDRIVSDTFPHIVPFIYDEEGDFDALTRAIDDEAGQLIVEPPGTVIPIQTEAGKHEMHLRGYMDEFSISRRNRFQIGRKNLSVGHGNINYTCTQIGDADEYDVTVTASIRNSGDIDIDEPVLVRFDYIREDGFVDSCREEIDGIASKEKASLAPVTIRARFGDHFLLTVNPDNNISGEYPGDNSYGIEFETGKITGITPSLSGDNVYLENVSVLNPMKVDTAGSIAFVELHTNSKVFVDDTPENGFCSIVDMGLLSPEQNYVQVMAFGYNGILLDSRKYYFNVRTLNQGKRSHSFPWAQFGSGSDTGSGIRGAGSGFDPDRIIMSTIDVKELAIAQGQAIRNSLLTASCVIPVIEEGKKVIYKIVALENSINNTYEQLNIEDVPIMSGAYNLPNGRGFINIISFDPANEICISTGAIPILDGGNTYIQMLNAMWQETINGIDQMIQENLDLESMLDDLLNSTLSQLDPANFRFGNLFFISYDFYPGLLGLYFFGFLDYSVDGSIHVNASDINVSAEFEAEVCLVCKEPGNIFAGYDIQARARFDLNASSNISISTPGASAGFLGLIGVRFFRFIYIPLVLGAGGIRVYPQQLDIPLTLNLHASLFFLNGVLEVAPAHAQFRASCYHDKRLATGGIAGVLLILPILAGSADVRANLKIDAKAKADLIMSMKPDFTPDLRLLCYAGGELDVDIRVRAYIYINLGFFVIKIPVYDETFNIHQEGSYGDEYSDEDVEQLIEEGTIIIGI